MLERLLDHNPDGGGRRGWGGVGAARAGGGADDDASAPGGSDLIISHHGGGRRGWGVGAVCAGGGAGTNAPGGEGPIGYYEAHDRAHFAYGRAPLGGTDVAVSRNRPAAREERSGPFEIGPARCGGGGGGEGGGPTGTARAAQMR